MGAPRAVWEEEYRSGRWDYLHSVEEAARLNLVAERALARQVTSILDLGCGEAPLCTALDVYGYRGAYLGVDWAITALSAAALRHPRRAFVCADLGALPVTGTFDLVVMSEVVYYLRDAPGAVSRALSLVAPEGELLVSLYQPRGDSGSRWVEVVARVEGAIRGLGAEQLGLVTSPDRGRAWSVLRMAGKGPE
ncbi:class I SAM-dependent methyltransferase [uncultured Cellulomonas sp.]|uniref:class I SAM-dependent methyltransferase n=1 Tax=uncultured Cellulomonas sp. TaxID=189682 RepID=UPI0028E3B798|nr:class I SAM-dependent methyltransferase [uncultured Cellulomonas sp.]